ncbi:hypothetical protein [Streptomyces syringium]|uniref:hypothetical protein n=1 Tax=Streptomyces syringium TaxID=76729 RepID=UPI0033BD6476
MNRVLLDEAVAVGDYLEVASERVTPDGRRRGEEYLRALTDPAVEILTIWAARAVAAGLPGESRHAAD